MEKGRKERTKNAAHKSGWMRVGGLLSRRANYRKDIEERAKEKEKNNIPKEEKEDRCMMD